MFVFVPMALMGKHLGFGSVFVFACAALSCVPLSYWLGKATEALGTRLGPVSGGLLNATFGNAAELIISAMALSHGLLIVVRASLIGSILGQLLLVLGTSLLLAGLKHKELRFSRALVQVNFTLIAIALLAIGLPSILLATAPDRAEPTVSFLVPTLAALLIVIYACSVVFSLRSQPAEDGDMGGPPWATSKGLLVLAGSTGGIILISERLVGSIEPFIEETGISQVFIGLILIPIFSNVVDHMVAITVALKNRMDLSLTVSVGSAAQVACLVLPIIVLLAFAMGQPLGLVFAPVELIALGAGLLLMVPVLLDGFSNWLEGAELLTCYFILAAVLWVL
jgi:Ca2+:H+ antiporter